MATKKQKVLVRRQAHERLALQRQQRLEREHANEADLVTFLLLQQQIADAERVFRRTADAIRHRQAQHLCGWRDRGEKPATIAELTGLSISEMNKLIKHAAPAPHEEAAGSARDQSPLIANEM